MQGSDVSFTPLFMHMLTLKLIDPDADTNANTDQ